MKRCKYLLSGACALSVTLLVPAVSLAASSFSNSLTGFTGDSTQSGTQSAVAAAGFSFFSTEGVDTEFTMDPTIVFDANGASFGSLYAGDGGRNYVRTLDSDYATVPFVAEITFTITDTIAQLTFFGMGSGDTALFGVPDWSTLVASTFVQPDESGLTTFRTQNDANEFIGNLDGGFPVGTHRLQMTFDPTAKTMIYAIDYNFASGAFTADFTAAPLDLNHIDCPVGCGFPEMPISADFFGPDGWPNEPSRIYFGADDGVVLKDFSVVVSDEPGQEGDFDDDGDVDGRDFLIWQRGGSPSSLGAGDLTLWQTNYGVGGLATISAVPEPSSLILLMSAALCLGRGKRK
jgi:hypothetical protein